MGSTLFVRRDDAHYSAENEDDAVPEEDEDDVVEEDTKELKNEHDELNEELMEVDKLEYNLVKLEKEVEE